MTNDSQMSGYRPPPRRTERNRGELLFQFDVGATSWSCELRTVNNIGVEAQFFCGEDFRAGRLWPFREEAIEWARRERAQIESSPDDTW